MKAGSDNDYRDEFAIDAPIEAVYAALSTRDGIRGWWNADADLEADGEVGGTIHLRWSETSWTDLRVERLDPPHAVEWVCTGCHVSAFDPPDEWVGTRIDFALAEAEGGTRLEIVHHGLAALDCLETCERGWTENLRTNLRELVERGVRKPVGA